MFFDKPSEHTVNQHKNCEYLKIYNVVTVDSSSSDGTSSNDFTSFLNLIQELFSSVLL